MNFGVYEGAFGFLPEITGGLEEFTSYSILAMIGTAVGWIFIPLGFSSWETTAMSISGLVAKENLVGIASTILAVGDDTGLSPELWQAFGGLFPTAGAIAAFGAFNLLCAPCFAAMGTIRAQMNSAKWTAIAIGYECGFAWIVGLLINQFYLLAQGVFSLWTIVAIAVAALLLFQIFRPMPRWAWDDDRAEVKAAAGATA